MPGHPLDGAAAGRAILLLARPQRRTSAGPSEGLLRRHSRRRLCRFIELFAGGRIVEAGCWAHVRRKFFDVHAATALPIAKGSAARPSPARPPSTNGPPSIGEPTTS